MTKIPGVSRGSRIWSTTRFRIRHALLDSRLVGSRYVRMRPSYQDQLITKSTRLVIEGYPRSANSFARYAIHVSQGDGSLLAGHNHSSAFVLEAVARGLPTIVIVRDPADAVASLVQSSDVSAWAAFEAYTKFHRNVALAASDVLVIPFHTVISDFAEVIRTINDRFGLGLAPFSDGSETRARISALLEESNRGLSGGVVDERSVARPSPERRPAPTILEDLSPRDHRALQRAEAAYQQVMSVLPPLDSPPTLGG